MNIESIGPRDNPPISDFVRVVADGSDYQIAFVRESDGEFEVGEEFVAVGDDAANEYAEKHYGGKQWYVLDRDGSNING